MHRRNSKPFQVNLSSSLKCSLLIGMGVNDWPWSYLVERNEQPDQSYSQTCMACMYCMYVLDACIACMYCIFLGG